MFSFDIRLIFRKLEIAQGFRGKIKYLLEIGPIFPKQPRQNVLGHATRKRKTANKRGPKRIGERTEGPIFRGARLTAETRLKLDLTRCF